MSDLIQHIIVITIVAGCVGYVAWAFVGTFRSGRGAGSCCGKGCGSATTTPDSAAPDSRGDKIVFIPSDSLRRRK